MFGSTCKGCILLFSGLQDNGIAGSGSTRRGTRAPSLRRNRRGRRGRGVSYSGIIQAGSRSLMQDVAVTRNWAMKILNLFRKLFSLIHRKDELTEAHFQRTLIKLRDQLIKKFRGAPPRQGPQNLRERFKLNPEKFFTFITTPGVQPTNNFTEQAIRYLIIDRRITQGTRSPKGRKWCERIWTTISTCEAQGHSTFQFLCDALTAHFNGLAPPSLVPAGP